MDDIYTKIRQSILQADLDDLPRFANLIKILQDADKSNNNKTKPEVDVNLNFD